MIKILSRPYNVRAIVHTENRTMMGGCSSGSPSMMSGNVVKSVVPRTQKMSIDVKVHGCKQSVTVFSLET